MRVESGDERPRDAWDRQYSRQPRLWKGPACSPFLPRGESVLELGCGGGKTLKALLDEGREVVAIDFSQAAVKSCGNVAGPCGQLHLLVAKAEELPFADSSFRTVVARHIIGHLLEEERRLAAAEAFRVLAPGGALHVQEFSRSDLRANKGKELEAHTVRKGTGVQTHFFEEEEMKRLFGEFELRRIYRLEAKRTYGGEQVLRSEIVAEFRRPVE